jgi:hypothetical protein
MAISEGLTCEICLRADDPEAMFSVAIPHAAHNVTRTAVLCRTCAWLIAKACRATGELPPLEAVDG